MVLFFLLDLLLFCVAEHKINGLRNRYKTTKDKRPKKHLQNPWIKKQFVSSEYKRQDQLLPLKHRASIYDCKNFNKSVVQFGKLKVLINLKYTN